PRGAGDFEHGSLGGVDAGEKDTPVERVQPRAAPPPARQDEDGREQPSPRAVLARDGEREQTGADCERGQGGATEIRCGDPDTQRGDVRVWRGSGGHGTTRSRSWSSRAGPIPGTASSWSMEL